MAASSSRNNILAGSFLLVSLALGVIASFVLSDFKERLKATTEYTIRFSIADGAAGIKSGSPVLLGGQPVGKVIDVEIIKPQTPASGDKTGTIAAAPRGSIDIEVSVSSEFTLYDNALFYLEKPLLGSLTSINIASLGDVESLRADQQIGPSPQLMPEEPVMGHIAPPSFLAQAGVGTEQVVDIKQMIAQAKDAISKINGLINDNEDLINQTLADIRAGVGDAKGAIKGFSDKVPSWTGSVDDILANADSASKGLVDLRDNASGLINDGRGLIADGRAVINDNRPQIDGIIDNIDRATAQLNTNLDPLMTQTRDAMANFASLSERLDTMVATEGPNIRHMLANTRLATDQLKLALIEIRAQPWRLLVQPNTKELQQQLLYDSARTYAAAVSDLRAASEALETTVAENTDTVTVNPQTVAERMAELDAAFVKYREAEKKLFEQMSK
ncbi:MAG: hypothetical protein IT435_05035 [Phycisphaerales bacterium]|nr:hypothetical protein [Phycisphaerales bacterium]